MPKGIPTSLLVSPAASVSPRQCEKGRVNGTVFPPNSHHLLLISVSTYGCMQLVSFWFHSRHIHQCDCASGTDLTEGMGSQLKSRCQSAVQKRTQRNTDHYTLYVVSALLSAHPQSRNKKRGHQRPEKAHRGGARRGRSARMQEGQRNCRAL